MYSKICLTNGKIRLMLIILTCSAALFLPSQCSSGVQGLVLDPHQIFLSVQTCLFRMTKGKAGLHSSRPPVWLYTPSVMFRDQPESSRCFTQQKIVFGGEKKKINKTTQNHFLKQLLLGLGLKRVDGGKRETGQKIRLQPDFGERCCVLLHSPCHWQGPPGQEIHSLKIMFPVELNSQHKQQQAAQFNMGWKCKVCSSFSPSLCFNCRVSPRSVRNDGQPRLSTAALQSTKWATTARREEERDWRCHPAAPWPRHGVSQGPGWAWLDRAPYLRNAQMSARPPLQGTACLQFSSQPPVRKHKPSDKRILHFLLAAFSGFFNLLSFWV